MRILRILNSLLGVIICVVALLANSARGEENRACETFNTAQDILDCATLKSPDLQRAAAMVRTHETAERKARQRPNPELESRILFGVADSENDILSETNIYHPLELGGKRRARIGQAKTGLEISKTEQRGKREQTVIETVLVLHRLRQIQSEKATLKENLSTYQKIENIYQRRPLLSPEQETALTVFNLNSREAQLEMISLLDEESRLKLFLKTSLGVEMNLSSHLLPSAPAAWPQKELEHLNEIENWSQIKKAKAQLQGTKASLTSAKSEAWPTLKFGPSLETDSPLGDTKVAVGFTLSTSLPFYQRNEGGKALAKSEEKAAELNLELLRKKGTVEMEKFIQEYNRNLKALKGAKALSSLEKKHHEIEELFERGLIHSTLMLEAHRQMYELRQQFHQNELRAIAALWNIYALEGRIFEERI